MFLVYSDSFIPTEGSGSGSGEYYAANNNVWRCVYWVQWSTIPCLVLALFTGTGGCGGGAKYQISEDEKCQNPFAGNPATLPAPRPDSGQQTNASLSVRRRNKLVTCDAIHCNIWSMAHLQPPIIRTRLYDLLFSGWFTLSCNSCLTSQANHLARCKKHHQSTSEPVNARTNYAAKDRDRPPHKTLATWSPRELRVKRAPGLIRPH